MTTSTDGAARADESARRRRTPLLLLSGAGAAALLVLAVNGTLSSWTTAIIDNPDNSVAATGAVALVETGPGAVTCDTGTSSTNQVSCPGINKYGGTGSPLDPDSATGGNTQSVSVNLKNTGTVAGDLELGVDTCLSTAALGSTGADPAGHPVCDQVTVSVVCTAPATMDTSGAAVSLATFPGGPVGTLAAGASTDCTFTLTLPAATSSSYASQVASQGLHWTLTAS